MTPLIALTSPRHKGSATPAALPRPDADGFSAVLGGVQPESRKFASGKTLPGLSGKAAELPPPAQAREGASDPLDVLDDFPETPAPAQGTKRRDVDARRIAGQPAVARHEDSGSRKTAPRGSAIEHERERRDDRRDNAVRYVPASPQDRPDPIVAPPHSDRPPPPEKAVTPEPRTAAKVATSAPALSPPVAKSRALDATAANSPGPELARLATPTAPLPTPSSHPPVISHVVDPAPGHLAGSADAAVHSADKPAEPASFARPRTQTFSPVVTSLSSTSPAVGEGGAVSTARPAASTRSAAPSSYPPATQASPFRPAQPTSSTAATPSGERVSREPDAAPRSPVTRLDAQLAVAVGSHRAIDIRISPLARETSPTGRRQIAADLSGGSFDDATSPDDGGRGSNVAAATMGAGARQPARLATNRRDGVIARPSNGDGSYSRAVPAEAGTTGATESATVTRPSPKLQVAQPTPVPFDAAPAAPAKGVPIIPDPAADGSPAGVAEAEAASSQLGRPSVQRVARLVGAPVVVEPLPVSGESLATADRRTPTAIPASPGAPPRAAIQTAEPVRSTTANALPTSNRTTATLLRSEPTQPDAGPQSGSWPSAVRHTTDAVQAPATPAISEAQPKPEREPQAARVEAAVVQISPTTTTAAVPQREAALRAAALDTATRLVARPGSASRPGAPGEARAATVAEPQPPTLTTAAALAATAAAAAPSQPAPVDMTRHTWPAAMIVRIERLRDELNAVSTAIRLIPDALGTIDVSLTQADGVTHVHLAAEQPQTRTLLAEAAPKLAELAEQRGLRLGDAQVQSGPNSNGGGQQSAAQQSPRRAAPASTPAAHKRADPTTDDRIA